MMCFDFLPCLLTVKVANAENTYSQNYIEDYIPLIFPVNRKRVVDQKAKDPLCEPRPNCFYSLYGS